MPTEPSGPAATGTPQQDGRAVTGTHQRQGGPAVTGTSRQDDLSDRLTHALVCAAAEPALSGVLLLDLEPRLVDPVARLFTGILTGTRDVVDAPLVLGASDRDEDLWTRTRLARDPHGITFRTEPGPLIEAYGRPGTPPLAVVPDLARLSVAGMRAAVQVLGADVVVVERTGLRRTLRPRTRWLAACRAADVGRLSRHLLERFAVRLSVADLRTLSPPETLLDGLPPAWRTAGTEGVRPVPVADEALTRLPELLGHDASVRRELALLRIARTLAALDGASSATAGHCDAAARLIGLAVPETPQGPEPEPAQTDPPHGSPILPRTVPNRRPGRDEPHRHRGEDRTLLETGPAEGIGTASGGGPGAPGTPFPEDEAPDPHDFAPLRGPGRRANGPVTARGTVIATRRATDLHDLAHVRTVREAAVHQRVRRTDRFTVSPIDLHSNVRAGAPERVLVLLLDHTCRGPDWDWQDALTPFLQWAYAGRAAIHVIEVGAADARNELRAESFAARGVLDPRVLAALYRRPGRATPLAHGIELAAQALRRAFRLYGTGPAEAWLVVVTDGRGNIPLRAGQTGRLRGEVAAAGVEDAVEAAARIAAMDRTRLHVAVSTRPGNRTATCRTSSRRASARWSWRGAPVGDEPQRGPRWLKGAGTVVRRASSLPGLKEVTRRPAGPVTPPHLAHEPPARLGGTDAQPDARLEDGFAVLHALRSEGADGRQGYRLHGWCGDLTLTCEPGPTRLAAPAVRLAVLRQEGGEYPSEVLRGIQLWSGNQPELVDWLNLIRARHGDALRLVVWDDTGYDLPWELFWLPDDPVRDLRGGPLGALTAVSRWTTVHDEDQELPREVGDCHGRVLGYLHQDMTDDGRVFDPYTHRLHRCMTPFLRDLDTPADRTGLVYLGCHGTYGDTVPRLSLGDRTWAELNGEPMAVLHRDRSLVCLNACDSGRFVDNRAQGEEALRGFAELFLRKGAGGCIVTAGKVGDLEARRLVRRLVGEVAEHPYRPVPQTLRDFRARAVREFGSLADVPRVRDDDGRVDTTGQKRVLRLLYAFMFHYYGHPRTTLRLTTADGRTAEDTAAGGWGR
ncbi:CHAT domain-containing protein [Streptomyces sp. NPDC005925]|uniref:CHAT domain-containing protein n=1 Tax=Streptomyces sp. NPDC005925 TaxID=3157172 RepID=UPI0033D3367B